MQDAYFFQLYIKSELQRNNCKTLKERTTRGLFHFRLFWGFYFRESLSLWCKLDVITQTKTVKGTVIVKFFIELNSFNNSLISENKRTAFTGATSWSTHYTQYKHWCYTYVNKWYKFDNSHLHVSAYNMAVTDTTQQLPSRVIFLSTSGKFRVSLVLWYKPRLSVLDAFFLDIGSLLFLCGFPHYQSNVNQRSNNK